ncbi:MAG: bifunctional riboflavin kinase/FAD synthetase [Lachnospiraceae bacterium]|nr:bifunctional riboflavin kinase/FAD synthetase [Lachnospiraceae bacterium]
MRIFSDLDNLRIDSDTAIAMGKFDGIHLGHMRLFDEVFSYRKRGLKTLVFTFASSVMEYLSGRKTPMLTTNEERREICAELKADYLVEYPVNDETMGIDPEVFLKEILVGQLRARAIVSGADCSFGAGGRGNFELLKERSAALGYEAVLVDKVVMDGQEISSTAIRGFVEEGRMEKAESFLGHPYAVYGKVIHGRALGRKIEMPTVNINPEENKILPPFGVYESYVYVGSQRFRGLTNIGIKPTVSDRGAVTVETHIIDFDDDLYGEKLKIELLHFQRAEKKFENVDELKKQMLYDKIKAIRFHENRFQ